MDELALAIVVRTLLGADLEREAGALAADLRTLARRLPLLAVVRARQPAGRIDAEVRRCIARAAPSHPRELLAVLLEPDAGGAAMSPELARDEALTLFLAGYDTTAAALTWTWYLLAHHPEVDRRLRRELDEVLGPRDPSPDDCAALAYTGMVLEESLRLYPPVGRIGRRPLADYRIGGRVIPAGAAVFLSPFVTQRDPRWWPDPERFDPERWCAESVGARPRYAAFPFGAGPRSCIGGAMAQMTGVLAIATIARRWRMRALPSRPPRPRSILTVKPRWPLRLLLERPALSG